MRLVKRLASALALGAVIVSVAGATVVKQESVTGGALDQSWSAGFTVPRTFSPLTLSGADPAYSNPSGDHTVAVLQNNDINLGGIAGCATDPNGNADYTWEGWFFTGAGNTRRGLLLRADPTNEFQSCYQFVINAGLFTIRFRKLVNAAPLPDLASWPATVLTGGIPQQNTWHHMKVVAFANTFRCFFDGQELTTTPVTDNNAPLLGGWVGAYNFSAATGEVPVYFDDLKLSIDGATPANRTSWGRVKNMFR